MKFSSRIAVRKPGPKPLHPHASITSHCVQFFSSLAPVFVRLALPRGWGGENVLVNNIIPMLAKFGLVNEVSFLWSGWLQTPFSKTQESTPTPRTHASDDDLQQPLPQRRTGHCPLRHVHESALPIAPSKTFHTTNSSVVRARADVLVHDSPCNHRCGAIDRAPGAARRCPGATHGHARGGRCRMWPYRLTLTYTSFHHLRSGCRPTEATASLPPPRRRPGWTRDINYRCGEFLPIAIPRYPIPRLIV